jgi:molybdopterin molybdotransferase
MALMRVQEARERIVSTVKPLAVEAVKLELALDRVLAERVSAKRDQPPFEASAMDGYAVRFEDVAALPATLKVIGTSAAGHGFKGRLKAGAAVRILTGAPVPKGADTVVIQENVERDGDRLLVLHATPKGKNIRRAGLDFARGDVLFEKGVCLAPRDLGLLAAANCPKVKVYRRPRVIVLTTGDELVLPGGKARADQIYSSNSHAIAAMVQRFGGEVINLGIVRDTMKATIAAVKKGLSADILVTTGGASVGDHDYVQAAFKACGVKIDFWKIAMRPGKPFMYGRKGRTHVMGLPGNPVSALVTARLFLKPLMDQMRGRVDVDVTQTARLVGTLPANDQRQDYVRATLEQLPDGTRLAMPFASQDSSMQRTLQLSQGLIIRAADAPAAADGTQIDVLLLDF